MRLTVDDIEKIERVANKIILLTEAGEPITECIEICTKKERSGNLYRFCIKVDKIKDESL